MSLNEAGHLHLEILSWVTEAGGGEGGWYSHTLPIRVCAAQHTLPIRVCAAQRGRDFEAPDLERGIHFRCVF